MDVDTLKVAALLNVTMICFIWRHIMSLITQRILMMIIWNGQLIMPIIMMNNITAPIAWIADVFYEPRGILIGTLILKKGIGVLYPIVANLYLTCTSVTVRSRSNFIARNVEGKFVGATGIRVTDAENQCAAIVRHLIS